jgi:hypothetical protein
MDLGPVAGCLRPFPSEYGADLPAAGGRGDKRPGDRPHAAMVASRPGEADKMPTAVTSFKASVRVSIWLGLPARPTLMGWLG